jgi:hypothetical protein
MLSVLSLDCQIQDVPHSIYGISRDKNGINEKSRDRTLTEFVRVRILYFEFVSDFIFVRNTKKVGMNVENGAERNGIHLDRFQP